MPDHFGWIRSQQACAFELARTIPDDWYRCQAMSEIGVDIQTSMASRFDLAAQRLAFAAPAGAIGNNRVATNLVQPACPLMR
jgi:hypothetical protein